MNVEISTLQRLPRDLSDECLYGWNLSQCLVFRYKSIDIRDLLQQIGNSDIPVRLIENHLS